MDIAGDHLLAAIAVHYKVVTSEVGMQVSLLNSNLQPSRTHSVSSNVAIILLFACTSNFKSSMINIQHLSKTL